TEMWERLSYYGMRAFLIFYITGKVEDGCLGMSLAGAGIVMALYQSSVYMLSLPGGWIADRFVGQRRAVTMGGIGIMLGNILLAMPTPSLFYPALVCIALGTGLLKPNVSTLVGQLYKADDIRRDAGYTVYYMGINIGALFGPIACGFFAQSETFRSFLLDHNIDPRMCWHYAFGLVAVGMALGVVQYVVGWRRLGDSGLRPTIPEDASKASRDRMVLAGILVVFAALAALIVLAEPSKDVIGNLFGVGLLIGAVALFVGMMRNARDADEKRRITAMIPLFIGGVAFFATFEQASTTLNIFAEQAVQRVVPVSMFQSINSLFIIAIAPIFAALWLALARRGKEPSSVNKFAWGMIMTAIAFVVVLPALHAVTSIAHINDTVGAMPYAGGPVDNAIEPLRVSPMFLAALYFFQTTSELCISPVGLSSMSKLAPTRMAGMVMGTWFLATAIGNYLAGRAAGLTADKGFGFLFWMLIIASLIVAAALFLIAPVIKKMMAGGEPQIPTARVVAEGEATPAA
ncbi:MAG TPA: oligopeptide:H+ symporter, partial [Kofleriaceae bacterium]